MKKQCGFTLIESAMVLIVIGLLLGGMLQSQELLQSARVRNQIALQEGVKGAVLAFQDRFRAYPGDFSLATRCIGGATVDGDGNGRIEPSNGAGTREDIAAWEHLSHAGFTTSLYTYNAFGGASSIPASYYNIPLQLVFDDIYGDPAATMPPRHGLKTGNQIPAAILAEIDRKIDDDNALSGNFRFSAYAPGGSAPEAATCYSAASGRWNPKGLNDPNCGGASLF
jgi:prepilin-type N-terminal cleavage/methylation domain-containing protein